jgi:hypothetical protein
MAVRLSEAREEGRRQGRAGAEAELRGELEALFESQNKSIDPGKTAIPATFLRVTVAVD